MIAGLVYSFTGCVYDKKDVISANTCDTITVSYSQTIAPILSTNCYSCHNATNANNNGDGIEFDTYITLKSVVDSGWMLPAVNWQINLLPPSYDSLIGSPGNMPLGLPQLSTCELSQISAWVNQGAKNN